MSFKNLCRSYLLHNSYNNIFLCIKPKLFALPQVNNCSKKFYSVSSSRHCLQQCLLHPRHIQQKWQQRSMATEVNGGPVKIKAEPQVCMHDVHSSISIDGLDPASPVTLRVEVFNDAGKQFLSHAQYLADERGCVAVDTAESVGGCYTGVFPAGLLTTLAPPPGAFPFHRLYRKDPAFPWQMTITAHHGHHPVTASPPPSPTLHSVQLTRYLMAPGVTRHAVRAGRVRGVMYKPPPGFGPAVGVVDMFGSVGGLLEFRAAMLASRGYAVLALPFFGYEDLPPIPHTLDLEYFEEAVDYVLAQDNVIPDRCGMISVSKSTDIAMLLSTKMPKLTAVVCIGVVCISYDTNIMYKGKMLVEGFKLTADNMTVDDMGRISPSKDIVAQFKVFEKDEDHPGILKLEEASPDCHYLLVAGDEDTWLCYESIPYLEQRMARFNRSDKVEGVIYPGAGHIIEPPYGPLLHHSYQRVLPVQTNEDDDSYVTGIPILFGGKAKETCLAQVDLWTKMQAFLNRRVRDSSPWYQEYLKTNTGGQALQSKL